MIVKRAYQVQSLKSRRFNRLLYAHVELQDVQQHLQQRLVLVVSARRGQYKKRLTILENQCWVQCYARPLSGLEYIRMPGFEETRLHALAHQYAAVASYQCGQPRTERRSAEHDSIFVHRIHASRIVGPLGLGYRRLAG